MTTILDKIAEARLIRVEADRKIRPEGYLRDLAQKRGPTLDPLEILSQWPTNRRAVISEVKRRSPSKGDIAPGIDAGEVAAAYERGGAFAISCLVESDFFGGSIEDLQAVRKAVKIPVLYKDFVADPYQILEARAFGADMVLLIVALLGEKTGEYLSLAKESGLTPLVEVHDEEELKVALEAGSGLAGVNNRNLKTFEVDLAVGERLISMIPPDVYAVGESGIKDTADMDRLEHAGAKAFLIGETLVKSPDPAAALAKLVKR